MRLFFALALCGFVFAQINQAQALEPSPCASFSQADVSKWIQSEQSSTQTSDANTALRSANPLTEHLKSWLRPYEEQRLASSLNREISLKGAAAASSCQLTLSYRDTLSAQTQLSWTFLISSSKNQEWLIQLPLEQHTQTWQQQAIGPVRYHFVETIDEHRAKKFADKYALIARTLGQAAEAIDFYLVEDYQQFLQLIGIEYSDKHKHTRRDGYGIVASTVFSVMGDPDFSHDSVHYYAAKAHTQRNWPAEEGVAYWWGNAYYTGQKGQAAEFSELLAALVPILSQYRHEQGQANWWQWWHDNPTTFFRNTDMAPETSIRALISALLCEYLWQQQGMDGLTQLMNAGRGQERFLEAIDHLLGINEHNFNERIDHLWELRSTHQALFKHPLISGADQAAEFH